MSYLKSFIIAVGIIFISLLSSSVAFAQAALVDDAHVNNSPKALDTNYGTSPNIPISPSGNAYVKFKIASTLPANTTGSDVAKATLKLYIGGVSTPGKIDLFLVTSAWDETTITAANAPATGDLVATTAQIDADKKGKFIVLDVTSAVQQWLGDGTNNTPNYGLALAPHPLDANTPTLVSVTVDSKENPQTSHEAALDIQLRSGDGGGLTTVAHDQTLTGDGTAGNPLGIATSGVGTAQLANDAVTSEKIAAGQVNTTQLADGAVTGVKIADASVTANKLAVPLVLSHSNPDFVLNVVNNGSGPAISATGAIDTNSQYNIAGTRVLSVPGTNTIAGVSAGQALTTGARNSFFGNFAGLSNTSGQGNSFFGYSAGSSNTTGILNSFFGAFSGQLNTTGTGNAFFGQLAGAKKASGDSNSFFGFTSGFSNTTGENNSFFGREAGASNINGSFNAFFGAQAGINNTTGIVNVFLGHSAGRNNTTGSSNTVVGSNAGLSNTTEGGNTFIGFSSNGAPGVINSTAIGVLATVTQSHSLVLGSNNVNVGIGTPAPQAKLHVNGGSILVSSPGQGVILKSPDGSTCRTLTIDNSGNLLLVPTTCPL